MKDSDGQTNEVLAAPHEALKVGDFVRLHLTRNEGDMWLGTIPSNPSWTGRIRMPPDRATVGLVQMAWIREMDVTDQVAQLQLSNRGRYPISAKVRDRYRGAAGIVRSGLDHGWAGSEAELSAISEVKGMLNRCVKMDQPDWLVVFIAMGRPERKLLSELVQELQELRLQLKNGLASAELPQLPAGLGESLRGLLDMALANIEGAL